MLPHTYILPFSLSCQCAMTGTNVTPTPLSLVWKLPLSFSIRERRLENQRSRYLPSSTSLPLHNLHCLQRLTWLVHRFFFSFWLLYRHRWSTYLLRYRGCLPHLAPRRLPRPRRGAERRRGVRSWTGQGKAMWIADWGDFILCCLVREFCSYSYSCSCSALAPRSISHISPSLCLVPFLARLCDKAEFEVSGSNPVRLSIACS